eukprot:756631-Hanusia_phi.AAC.1
MPEFPAGPGTGPGLSHGPDWLTESRDRPGLQASGRRTWVNQHGWVAQSSCGHQVPVLEGIKIRYRRGMRDPDIGGRHGSEYGGREKLEEEGRERERERENKERRRERGDTKV